MVYHLSKEEIANMPPLTIESTLLALTVHLNNRATIRQAAKEIRVSEERLRVMLKHIGYVYQQPIWYNTNRNDTEVTVIEQTTIREALEKTPTKRQRMQQTTREQINYLDIDQTKRSVTLDGDTYERFIEFCDDKEYFRSKALTKALIEFMEKYK